MRFILLAAIALAAVTQTADSGTLRWKRCYRSRCNNVPSRCTTVITARPTRSCCQKNTVEPAESPSTEEVIIEPKVSDEPVPEPTLVIPVPAEDLPGTTFEPKEEPLAPVQESRPFLEPVPEKTQEEPLPVILEPESEAISPTVAEEPESEPVKPVEENQPAETEEPPPPTAFNYLPIQTIMMTTTIIQHAATKEEIEIYEIYTTYIDF